MSILKLKPSCKDYLWGGHRLAEEYGIDYDKDILAEAWTLSCHPDGPSVIVNGEYAGKSLSEYIDTEGRQVLGTHCKRFRDFPILIKFIDAKQNLSIQVHPNNRYALKNEGQYGKTEMWYVMDAGENAFLYYGFQSEISREEFARRIEEDTLLEVLNAVPVQKGDVLFIESGTIHAIGKDILIAEIQQNSNVTYRVYDYGRVGADGKKRDLHIEKALAVTNRVPLLKDNHSYPHVADCDYFTVDKLNLDGKVMRQMGGLVTGESFASILILDGEGIISGKNDHTGEMEQLPFKKGESFFISAGSGAYMVEGTCDALITTIREKAGPVRIGMTIGGTHTRIGLVDVHQKIIASKTILTRSERPAHEVIKDAGETTLKLMEENGISFDQCVGAGIGVPGTVDSRSGIVRYSNNIKWKSVDLKKEMEAYFPIPIQIANDADCVALGEAVSGAGKDYQDVVTLTLGTGVGGGIILNGEIYEGARIGGGEFGHMVIAEDGEPCTCGRKGCLEAYASVPALRRDVKRATGADLTVEEIFATADQEKETYNPQVAEVVDRYLRRLSVGVVNAANIFRPQRILLGGTVGENVSAYIERLQHTLNEECFGGENGEIPVIGTAKLGNKAGMIGAASLT